MTKNVQWWHLLLSFIGTMIGIAMFYSMAIKNIKDEAEGKAKLYENHEQRIKFLEENTNDLKLDIKDIKKSNEQILILLQNKQDRK